MPPAANRAADVYDTAMGLIAERGYAGASLRELARRLGMSQPSLYHYFDSKEQLVARIIRSHSERTFEGRDAAPDAQGFEDPRALFRYVLDHLVASWERPSHLTFTRFLIAVQLHRPDLSAGLREEILTRSLAPVSPDLARLARAHGVAPAALEGALGLAIDALVGRFLQAQLLGIRSAAPTASGDELDFVIDVVLRGVLSPSPTSPEGAL